MKTKILVCCMSSLIVFAGVAKADVIADAITNVIQTKVNSFNMGAEFSDITYHEPLLAVKETGLQGGLYGEYEFRPDWGNLTVFHVDAHGNFASMDYTGSGKINDIDDYMFEPRIWIGHDFYPNSQVLFTPYVGVGYRGLYDSVGGKTSTTGAEGYDRFSQYLYAPAGFKIFTDVVPGWRFGFNPEFDIFIRGWQASYLSDIPGYPDLHNTQTRGYGVRGSFDIIKKMNRVNLVVSPYIRYWNIEKSNTVITSGALFEIAGYEPENRSTEYGVRLGVEF